MYHRALEQKKQAMAKAEEERRRKALEERRRTQQEATDRFRNAIYRNFRPLSTTSVPTTKSLKINPSTENIHSKLYTCKYTHVYMQV